MSHRPLTNASSLKITAAHSEPTETLNFTSLKKKELKAKMKTENH
jgi:hypothetical protein